MELLFDDVIYGYLYDGNEVLVVDKKRGVVVDRIDLDRITSSKSIADMAALFLKDLHHFDTRIQSPAVLMAGLRRVTTVVKKLVGVDCSAGNPSDGFSIVLDNVEDRCMELIVHDYSSGYKSFFVRLCGAEAVNALVVVAVCGGSRGASEECIRSVLRKIYSKPIELLVDRRYADVALIAEHMFLHHQRCSVFVDRSSSGYVAIMSSDLSSKPCTGATLDDVLMCVAIKLGRSSCRSEEVAVLTGSGCDDVCRDRLDDLLALLKIFES